MAGSPNSLNASQQKPYVVHAKDGKALSSSGEAVPRNSPEAHIPLRSFKFPT